MDNEQEFSAEEILNFVNGNNENKNKKQEEKKPIASKIINISKEESETLFHKNEEFKDTDVRFNIVQKPYFIFEHDNQLSLKDVKITDIEKDIFLRSILLEVPFELEISLANRLAIELEISLANRLAIEFRSINEETLSNIKQFLFKNYLANEDKSLLYLSFMLKSFLGNKVEFKNREDLNKRLEEIKEWVNKKEGFVKDFIFDAANLFQKKLVKLTNNLANEDFWLPLD